MADENEEDAEIERFGTTQALIGGGVMVAAAGFVISIAAHPRWMGPLILVIGLAVTAIGAMRLARRKSERIR